MQCRATTRTGRRCLHVVGSNGSFCSRHADRVAAADLLSAAAGALLGNLLVPGLGIALGAGAALALHHPPHPPSPSRRRVFVSFDYDQDRALKEFLVGQSRLPDSPFEIVDSSLKEAAPERTWVHKARTAIDSADHVVVLVGRYTYRAPGVLKEVALARSAGKPVFQLVGYKAIACPTVPHAGRRYRWTWPNLRNLLG